MKKILNIKKAKVEELSQKMKEAKSFILADYRGLTVEQDTQLRRKCVKPVLSIPL